MPIIAETEPPISLRRFYRLYTFLDIVKPEFDISKNMSAASNGIIFSKVADLS
jgi:hypothetical protein